MPKLRVYQLARELNRDNSEIIRELQHMGVPVTSHSNTVEDRLADALRKKLGVFEEPTGRGRGHAPPPPVEEVIGRSAEGRATPASHRFGEASRSRSRSRTESRAQG